MITGKKRRLILSLLLAMALTPLWAQGGLSCDVAVGWNGVVRAERYAPLIVSLENSGKKLACIVKLDIISGSQVRGTQVVQTFSQAVSLPARSRKRLFFVFPMLSMYRPVVVRVDSGDRELLRKNIDVGEMIVSDKLVVAVSSELSMDFLSGLMQEIRVVYPHVENLPESWAGYDGVDTVVFHDSAFQSLRAAQVSALQQWVFSGGTLIVSGGPAALQLKSAGLNHLLPVEVTGLVMRSRLPSLSGLSDEAAPPQGNMILAGSRLTGDATAMAEENGLPIVAQRRIGWGAVRFLAFDCAQPPMNGWAGNGALWRALTAGSVPSRPRRAVQEPADDPWLKSVLTAPAFFFPSAFILFGFLSVFILGILAVVNRRATRSMKASTRAVILIALALVATGASWALFERTLFPREAFLLEASTVQAVAADGLARVTEKVGLFSTGGGTFDFSVPRKTVLVSENTPARAGAPGGTMTMEISDGMEMQEIHLSPYGSRLFILDAVVELPVSASVSRGRDSRTVSVTNSSPFALRQSFFSVDGKLYPIGDIPAGTRMERELVIGSEASDAAVLNARHLAFWQQVKSGFTGETPQLFAWLDRSVFPVEAPAGFRMEAGEAIHLLVVETR